MGSFTYMTDYKFCEALCDTTFTSGEVCSVFKLNLNNLFASQWMYGLFCSAPSLQARVSYTNAGIIRLPTYGRMIYGTGAQSTISGDIDKMSYNTAPITAGETITSASQTSAIWLSEKSIYNQFQISPKIETYKNFRIVVTATAGTFGISATVDSFCKFSKNNFATTKPEYFLY
jgi:hypothetical protein